jgi:hypothetical protein
VSPVSRGSGAVAWVRATSNPTVSATMPPTAVAVGLASKPGALPGAGAHDHPVLMQESPRRPLLDPLGRSASSVRARNGWQGELVRCWAAGRTGSTGEDLRKLPSHGSPSGASRVVSHETLATSVGAVVMEVGIARDCSAPREGSRTSVLWMTWRRASRRGALLFGTYLGRALSTASEGATV